MEGVGKKGLRKSRPLYLAVPDVGIRQPVSICIVLVFPDPLTPSKLQTYKKKNVVDTLKKRTTCKKEAE